MTELREQALTGADRPRPRAAVLMVALDYRVRINGTGVPRREPPEAAACHPDLPSEEPLLAALNNTQGA